jgi:hypothetical protein
MKEWFFGYITSFIKEGWEKIEASGDNFLKEFVEFWENFKVYLRWNRKIFCYLEKHCDGYKHEKGCLIKEGF